MSSLALYIIDVNLDIYIFLYMTIFNVIYHRFEYQEIL